MGCRLSRRPEPRARYARAYPGPTLTHGRLSKYLESQADAPASPGGHKTYTSLVTEPSETEAGAAAEYQATANYCVHGAPIDTQYAGVNSRLCAACKCLLPRRALDSVPFTDGRDPPSGGSAVRGRRDSCPDQARGAAASCLLASSELERDWTCPASRAPVAKL